MKIPPSIKEKGLKIAKESTIFGNRFEDLDKEELIAIAAVGWQNYNDLLKNK